MARNRFADFVKEELGKIDKLSKEEKSTSLYLLELSINASGNDLNLLFSAQETKMIKEFLEVMKTNNYKGAVALKLEAASPKRILSASEMIRGSSAYKRKQKILNKIAWKTIWHGQGYPIGIIKDKSALFDMSVISKVYLCLDGKLRCVRCPSLFNEGRSLASGVGTIPSSPAVFKKEYFEVGEIEYSYDKEFGTSTRFQKYTLESYLKNLVKNLVINSM